VVVAVRAAQGQLLRVLLAVAMAVLAGIELHQLLVEAAAQAGILVMEAQLVL
jgi:hypothetical protein